MCGIAGLVAKSSQFGREDIAQLVCRMAKAMAHRGPDDAGVWVSGDGRVALSHRRLSIIDTSEAGHQPMASSDGLKRITFNGEIYNFLELKAQMESQGERFQTRSDTEVLIRVMERQGTEGLHDLDAMFAFGWFDEKSGELLLARDIFGEKPLYYYDGPEWFAFASELSALQVLPKIDLRIDASAIARYLAYQYIPAPFTIYRSIQKLPPGCFLRRSKDGRTDVTRYFRFTSSGNQAARRSLADAADELESILTTSIRRRLISDVPIGAFLSGGVDSSTVVALATKITKQPVQTFTIGFEGSADSEHFEAREMALHIRTEHHEQLLKPDGVALCAQIGAALDEPNGDSSCLPTYLLSAFARERVTVALSGDGGDELFGGYGRYLATLDESELKAREGGMDGWTPGTAYWSSRILVYPEDELEILTGSIPGAIRDELLAARNALDRDERPLINRLREADAGQYLPGAVLAKVDRMSMQSSLEVRAPLLGKDVAAFAMGLAAEECTKENQGKLVLKEVARRFLPDDWLNRPKRGFGLPMGTWGAKVLMPAARQLLLSKETRLQAWIPLQSLATYLGRMESDFSAYRVWSLLILEHWLRSHPHEVGNVFSAPDVPIAAPYRRALGSFCRLLRGGRRVIGLQR